MEPAEMDDITLEDAIENLHRELWQLKEIYAGIRDELVNRFDDLVAESEQRRQRRARLQPQ